MQNAIGWWTSGSPANRVTRKSSGTVIAAAARSGDRPEYLTTSGPPAGRGSAGCSARARGVRVSSATSTRRVMGAPFGLGETGQERRMAGGVIESRDVRRPATRVMELPLLGGLENLLRGEGPAVQSHLRDAAAELFHHLGIFARQNGGPADQQVADPVRVLGRPRPSLHTHVQPV